MFKEISRGINRNGEIKVYNFNIHKINPHTRKKRITSVTQVFVIGDRDVVDMVYNEIYAKVRVEKLKESEKAIQFRFIYEENEEGGDIDEATEWLPKSQITITEDGHEIPEWLSKKKRLGKYTTKKFYIVDEGPTM